MMAHYLYFLSLVNQYIFYYTACIFAKLSKRIPSSGHLKSINFTNMFAFFQYPLLIWFCARYNCHFKITISITSIWTTLSPLTYFYSLVRPEGKKFEISTGDVPEWYCKILTYRKNQC